MIAILGSGAVAHALATSLARSGRDFCIGSRNPEAVRMSHDNLRVLSTQSAIVRAEMVILAVPYAAALQIAGAWPDWEGRILVDCTNPLLPNLAGLAVGGNTSGAETIAQKASRARVVKGFSTVGVEVLADPVFGPDRAFLPVCGDDAEARTEVAKLASSMGFDTLEMGALSQARYLEPFAMVWIQAALRFGMGRQFAFQTLRR